MKMICKFCFLQQTDKVKLNRLWFYLMFLAVELLALYFLVASIWYWVANNRVA